MYWTASNTSNWVSLTATSGSLTAGDSTTVTVSLNSAADSLAAGSYNDTASFLNTTTGNGNTSRSVSLTVDSTDHLALYITNAARLGNDFVLSFYTQTGQDYTVEHTASLPPLSWSNLITLPGNGALVTLTNYNVPAGERYYRVRTP